MEAAHTVRPLMKEALKSARAPVRHRSLFSAVGPCIPAPVTACLGNPCIPAPVEEALKSARAPVEETAGDEEKINAQPVHPRARGEDV